MSELETSVGSPSSDDRGGELDAIVRDAGNAVYDNTALQSRLGFSVLLQPYFDRAYALGANADRTQDGDTLNDVVLRLARAVTRL